jgi:hypothetical protein
MDDFMERNKLFNYAMVFVAYLIISMIVFWPLALNMAGSLPGGVGGDTGQTLWELWWTGYSLFTLHTSPYFTLFLYYPVGANLVTQTLQPLAGLFSVPFQSVSLAFAYNIVFLTDFVLAGFFTYLLTDHLVKNKYAAFLAGVVFAFSPMHITQAFGHLNWTSIEFLPLFLLFFLLMIKDKMIKDKRLWYSLGAALSFVLLVFFGDPEQGIMTVLLVFILLVLYAIRREKRAEILNRKFLISLVVMVVLTLIIGSPFIVPIAKGVLNGALTQANQLNDVSHNMLWSNPALSFLLPGPFNNLFTWLSNSYLSIYSVDYTERVAYIGYAVLFLVVFGLLKDRKNKFKNTLDFLIIGVVFAWLSIGPYLQIGAPQTTSIPGLYMIYRLIPVFNLIREPGRFDLVVTLCLAVLAAFGFKEILEHVKVKGPSRKRIELYVTIVVALIVLIEYSGLPVSSSFINAYFFNAQIPKGYYEIGEIPGNFSMVILPALPSSTNGSNLYPGFGMYYQTAFKKPMISGYTSRVNETEQLPAISVPLVVAATYLQSGQGLVYPSPIVQNSTNVTLFWLATYRTAFVSVIRQAYNTTELTTLGNYLYSVFGMPVYQDNTTIIFATSNVVTNKVGKSLISYTAGTWIPGIDLCQSQTFCNATFAGLWWGTNVRAIDLYAPANMTNLLMNFTGEYYQGSAPVYVYLNSASNPIQIHNFTPYARNYSLQLRVSPGFNQLFFVSSNNTAVQYGQYINFGVSNITFSVVR